MVSPGRAYLAGAVGTLVSRAASVLAGITSLWLLTHILDTEAFAGYTVAFSIVILLGYSAGLGIERSMLLTLSGLDTDGRVLRGGRVAGQIGGVVGVLGCLVGLGVYVWAGDGVRGQFLRLLAPVVPVTAVTVAMLSWFQANHRVGTAMLMQGVTDASRCALFGVVFLAGGTAVGVAGAAVVAAAMPIAVLGFYARPIAQVEPGRLRLRDTVNGLQFLVIRLSNMGMRHFDIVLLGAFGSAVATAQYVVASRFAVVMAACGTMFDATLAPRARHHMQAGQSELALAEYRTVRRVGFAITLGLAVVFMMIGGPVLAAFGTFGTGYSVFLVLIAANLLPTGFGPASEFLAMMDGLRASTVIKVVGFVGFVASLVLVVPEFGAMGAAVAVLGNLLVIRTVEILVLSRKMGRVFLTLGEGVFVLVPVAITCGVAVWPAQNAWGAVGLGVCLAVSVARHRVQFLAIGRSVLGRD